MVPGDQSLLNPINFGSLSPCSRGHWAVMTGIRKEERVANGDGFGICNCLKKDLTSVIFHVEQGNLCIMGEKVEYTHYLRLMFV